jgi:anthranilate phosphoribosyltransferase
MLTEALANLSERRDLAPEAMRVALRAIMAGQCSEPQIAAFLTALRVKGETPAELAAAAAVLREHMIRLDVGARTVLDTCGTGGDHQGTFNISTAAALVVAGCGVPVVKHGNRGVSSASGSADVLTALGVQIDVEPEVVRHALAACGLAFCFAPRFHPAMRHVANVRKQLRFRTLFNLLGPLCNPAGARCQLIGVGRPELLDLLAKTLAQLGKSTACLVHGEDGLDEVTLTGATRVRQVRDEKIQQITWTPEDFGLPHCRLEELRVGGPEESAARIRLLLASEQGSATNVVLANASAALLAFGQVASLRQGVELAREAIVSGRARQVLDQLAAVTNAKEA